MADIPLPASYEDHDPIESRREAALLRAERARVEQQSKALAARRTGGAGVGDRSGRSYNPDANPGWSFRAKATMVLLPIIIAVGTVAYLEAFGKKLDLAEAIFAGDVSTVKDFVARNKLVAKSIVQDDKEARTPLHMAAIANQSEIARFLLLQHGARLDVIDNNYWTPLHYACLYTSADLVKLFIAQGANVDAQDKNGRTPLHVAVIGERTEIVSVLLAARANTLIADTHNMLPVSYGRMLLKNSPVTYLLEDATRKRERGGTEVRGKKKKNKNKKKKRAIAAPDADADTDSARDDATAKRRRSDTGGEDVSDDEIAEQRARRKRAAKAKRDQQLGLASGSGGGSGRGDDDSATRPDYDHDDERDDDDGTADATEELDAGALARRRRRREIALAPGVNDDGRDWDEAIVPRDDSAAPAAAVDVEAEDPDSEAAERVEAERAAKRERRRKQKELKVSVTTTATAPAPAAAAEPAKPAAAAAAKPPAATKAAAAADDDDDDDDDAVVRAARDRLKARARDERAPTASASAASRAKDK